MSGFFGLVKWGLKANKGAKAIDKVAPKAGKELTKKYLQSTQTKRNKAKISQSVVDRNKESKKIFELNDPSRDRNKESKKIFELNDPSRDRNKSSKEVFKKSRGE